MISNLRRNQSGFSHMVLVVVVLVLAVGGVGYYVWSQRDKKSNSAATTASSDKAVEEACKKEIDDKDFCKFASNWAGVENYTTTISSQGAEGTTTVTVEAENADKSHTTIKTGEKTTSESVIIGDTFYNKDFSDGKWTKFTSTPATDSSDSEDAEKIDFSEKTEDGKKIEYKKVAKEACGSLTCFKYQIIDPSDSSAESFVWFDDDDFLLRRYTYKNASGTTDMSVSYGNVKVSEPSPVKEGSASNGTTDPAEIQRQIEETMRAMEANQQ